MCARTCVVPVLETTHTCKTASPAPRRPRSLTGPTQGWRTVLGTINIVRFQEIPVEIILACKEVVCNSNIDAPTAQLERSSTYLT